jgi:hypothetical protein
MKQPYPIRVAAINAGIYAAAIVAALVVMGFLGGLLERGDAFGVIGNMVVAAGMGSMYLAFTLPAVIAVHFSVPRVSAEKAGRAPGRRVRSAGRWAASPPRRCSSWRMELQISMHSLQM